MEGMTTVESMTRRWRTCRRGTLGRNLYGDNGMAKRSSGNRSKTKRGVKTQAGKQQWQESGKQAWKRTVERNIDTQRGTGQVGQHPRAGEAFGSTPGEVRGHAGGKKGQAMGGKRGTANSRKAKSKRAGRK